MVRSHMYVINYHLASPAYIKTYCQVIKPVAFNSHLPLVAMSLLMFSFPLQCFIYGNMLTCKCLPSACTTIYGNVLQYMNKYESANKNVSQ